MKVCTGLLLAGLLAGCAGIQGGQEGEELDHCVYDTVPLSDPDAVAEGFTQSPRELFASATGSFSGTLSNGRAVRLEFEPGYADLHALYAQGAPEDCAPGLATAALASLTVDSASDVQAADSAQLEIRSGLPLASVRFEAGPNTPLAAAIPAFSKEPLSVPTLDVWLTGLELARVDSEWHWSAFVSCAQGETCTGGPALGVAVPTSGAEVSWGNAQLTRD